MKKSLVILLLCMLILTIILFSMPEPVTAAVQTVFYVSSTGNDNNSGTLSQPYRTIEKAQESVRAINNNMTGDIIVYLMGGTYSLNSTLSFSSQDSGTNEYNVIYKAYNDETPIVSGGIEITGWAVHDPAKGIYKAYVGTNFDTRQFYVDGVRAIRARGEENPSGWAFSTSTGYTVPLTGFYSNMASWSNANNIEFVYKRNWQNSHMGVDSISGNNIIMKQPGWGNETYGGTYPGTPSWIENAYELLDSSGEWYLNRSTGYIYYIPRSGEDMLSSKFIASKVEELLHGEGTLDTPIHNIQFDGITFSYNTWLLPNGNECYSDAQSGIIIATNENGFRDSYKVTAAVNFSAAKNIAVINCTFKHIGNAALSFEYGSQNNLIDYNTIYDISASGITIGNVNFSEDHHPADARVIVKDNIVSNNTIYDIGNEYYGSVGIFAGYTDGTVIKHNTLYNLPYTAISVGWGWGADDLENTSVAKNNIISHNKIYDFMKVLSDGGGIYTLGSQPGTYVYNNYLTGMSDRLSYLYRDNGSCSILDTNNVISSESGSSSYWYYSAAGYSEPHLNSYYNEASNNYLSDNLGIYAVHPGINTTPNTFVSNNNWPANAQSIIANSGVGGGIGPLPTIKVLQQIPYIITNVARGSYAWSSSHSSTAFSASKAIDGAVLAKNGWASTPTDTSPWIELDLGKAYNITSIEIPSRPGYDQPETRRNFEIRASNNGDMSQGYVVLASVGSEGFANGTTWKVNISALNSYRYIAVVKTDGAAMFIPEIRVLSRPNIALNKSAIASSQWSSAYSANFAVDGIVSMENGWASASTDTNPWFLLDLENASLISKIEIYSRPGYDHPESRRNFEIWGSNNGDMSQGHVVLASVGSEGFENGTTWSADISDLNSYRYIAIVKTDGEQMFIPEIRVFSRPNIALNKGVSSSSQWSSAYSANFAVDGNLAMENGWASASTDTSPWFMLDLGRAYRLTNIEIASRPGYDQPVTRCNFEIWASNSADMSQGHVVLASVGSEGFPNGTAWKANITDLNSYRYIAVIKTDGEEMFIPEIRVFSYY